MNKKILVTKLLKFIYKTNFDYKRSNFGDMILIAIFIFTLGFGKVSALMVMLLVFALRSIYEFDILKRLEVISEEENKIKDEEIIENVR